MKLEANNNPRTQGTKKDSVFSFKKMNSDMQSMCLLCVTRACRFGNPFQHLLYVRWLKALRYMRWTETRHALYV